MNDEAINYVMWKMSDRLDNSQMIRLQQTLEEAFRGDRKGPEKSSEELLEHFLATKRLEGRSEKNALPVSLFDGANAREDRQERLCDEYG